MSDETKCKACGQELPKKMMPVQTTGIVKWIRADRKEAAVELDGGLVKVWAIYCPTLKEVALSEGDRVKLAVRRDKYGDPEIVRVALPSQALMGDEATV